MAPQEHPKPRNNARKAAARALQRRNPGMSYTQALAQLTTSTASNGATNPLDLQALLNVSSADDIRTRHDAHLLNTVVPVGIDDTGGTVTLDIADAHHQEAGTGPHGCIVGPKALNFALAMATALRANNSAERVRVTYAGAKHHGRTAAHAVDHVIADAGWHDWLAAQLVQRGEIARATGVKDIADLTDYISSLIVLIDVSGPLSVDEETSLVHAVRIGRSLGVHAIVIGPDTDRLRQLQPGILRNLTFNVLLADDGQRCTAQAQTLNDRDANGLRRRAHVSFTPTRFSRDQLAAWINAARRPTP